MHSTNIILMEEGIRKGLSATKDTQEICERGKNSKGKNKSFWPVQNIVCAEKLTFGHRPKFIISTVEHGDGSIVKLVKGKLDGSDQRGILEENQLEWKLKLLAVSDVNVHIFA